MMQWSSMGLRGRAMAYRGWGAFNVFRRWHDQGRTLAQGLRSLGVVSVLTLSGLAACTHVKGVVLAAHTERPMANAQFTVGRPDMFVLDRHRADSAGRFDFFISPLDETNLYVWDGRGDPTIAVRRIDRLEISDHMVLHISDVGTEFGIP